MPIIKDNNTVPYNRLTDDLRQSFLDLVQSRRECIVGIPNTNDLPPDCKGDLDYGPAWLNSSSLTPFMIQRNAELWLDEFLTYRRRGEVGHVNDAIFFGIAEQLIPIAEQWGIDSTPISRVMEIIPFAPGTGSGTELPVELVERAYYAMKRIEEKAKFHISESVEVSEEGIPSLEATENGSAPIAEDTEQPPQLREGYLGLRFDDARRQVTRENFSPKLGLTKLLWGILNALSRNRDIPLSRSRLKDSWYDFGGHDDNPTDGSVKDAICALRAKIAPLGLAIVADRELGWTLQDAPVPAAKVKPTSKKLGRKVSRRKSGG